MLFNSLSFFIFAIIFFPLYFLTSGKTRVILSTAASYFFYGCWDWRFLSLLIVSTLINFIIGGKLGRTKDPRSRKLLFFVSLCSNLGILGFFKYFNFFVSSLTSLFSLLGFQQNWISLEIILPVGISFYTFQTMSYTIDIYRSRLEPESNFLIFAAYVALFPQLVAGPIVRASSLLPQLCVDQRFCWTNLIRGLELVAFGFFLKVLVADNLAPVVDLRFNFPDEYNSMELLLGVFFFTFQIYGDFAGYSLIAIGLGRIMGLDFGVNFNRPYFSKSFSEFWERWHISLSSWLRDYLYIPLGGNRGNRIKIFRNLLITMFLGGLWHGANWTFVFWGLLHGMYLILQRMVGPVFSRLTATVRWPIFFNYCIQMATVFVLTMVAWVFFRSQNIMSAFSLLRKIAKFELSGKIVTPQVLQGLSVIGVLLAIETAMSCKKIREFSMSHWWIRLTYIQVLIWSIALFGNFTGQEFIYFDF